MKLPPEAKQVFKGKIFDVYQWEQPVYDGSIGMFEMLKRPNTVQILATVRDKIIISHEEQPSKPLAYTFLGGRAEEQEDPLVTAKRELLEESGLVSDDWELYKTYEPYTKFDWKIFFFLARNCRKVAEQHLDPGEKITLEEVSFDRFLEIVSDEKFWALTIANDFLRLRLNPAKLATFRDHLFPYNSRAT
jgi:ADP-ribose pyrophosphatase